jgi:predicted phage gp36 major capsid-like protein
VEEISKDMDKIQEDSAEDDQTDAEQKHMLESIEDQLQKLLKDIEAMRK